MLLDEYFVEITKKYQQAVREVVAIAVQAGVPVPTFSSAILLRFLSFRSLTANLIQAQRDYFGAHTYERTDKESTIGWYNEEINTETMSVAHHAHGFTVLKNQTD